MRNIFKQKSVQITLVVWILAVFIAFLLGRNGLPFDRPLLEGTPSWGQILIIPLIIVPIYLIIFMGLTYLITRKRVIPDMSSRAPEMAIARKETLLLLLYGAVMLGLGQWIGNLIGNHGIGLHLHGSIFGPTEEISPNELVAWAVYNFVAYAAIPYFYFRTKGYSHETLNLRSSNLKNDVVLIFVILAVGITLDLFAGSLFNLTGTQLLGGLSLSFLIHFIGTAVPVMIFIYCILLPRYLKLSGSMSTTVILGGLTYAGLHIFEYWTVYDSLANSALSVIFVFMQFFVPGMIKSFLTLRTGNAWVHVWAYHAISPHVTADTPNIVETFKIK